jgi:glycosyltransferase involved in cell wall biosynthesis
MTPARRSTANDARLNDDNGRLAGPPRYFGSRDSEAPMPKLLSVNNYHYRRGGSDVVFLEHDALFQRRGWETAVFSMRHPRNLPSAWERYFVDEIEYESDPGLLKRLGQASKVIWSGESVGNVNRLLAAFPADIVHAHGVYHHLSPSVLYAAKRAGVPTVMTQHDLKLACPAYKMLNTSGICEKCRGGNLIHVVANRCIRESYAASALVMVESAIHKSFSVYSRYVDRLVAPSRFYVDKLVEWGWDRARIRYVPNYVDAAAFQPQYSPGDYLLYFGRLAPEKGLPTLLRAAAAADQPLAIAGTGPLEPALRELAGQLGSQVDFLGYRSGTELHDAIRGARAVVLPSEWYENAPMSVLESFALGKPVIGARIGGIPELIDEGLTGFVFKSGDATSLADVLRKVGGMPSARLQDMGRAARAFVESTFTEDRYYRELAELYSELGVELPVPIHA